MIWSKKKYFAASEIVSALWTDYKPSNGLNIRYYFYFHKQWIQCGHLIPIIALYFEFESVLKFYNIDVW